MNFYITFGQQYRERKHPSGHNCHPDGYWIIEADDYDLARDIANTFFGEGKWSGIYSERFVLPTKYYPMGELGRLSEAREKAWLGKE